MPRGLRAVAGITLTVWLIGSGILGPRETVDAVVNGVEAGTRLANVGMVVGRFEVGGPWQWLGCSGTLIARQVFLSAAHCVAPNVGVVAEFGVTFTASIPIVQGDFNPPIPPGVRVYAGEAYVHPDFVSTTLTTPEADSFDLAVIRLIERVVGMPPAQLVPPDHFDLFRNAYEHLGIGQAGYGNTSFLPFLGLEPFDWGVRRYTTGRLDTVYPAKITVAPAPGQICAGDSGGPGFPAVIDALELPVPPYVHSISAIVSFTVVTDTTLPCETASILYRLDTPQAREFLGEFVTLKHPSF
jgi:hypothetical protein